MRVPARIFTTENLVQPMDEAVFEPVTNGEDVFAVCPSPHWSVAWLFPADHQTHGEKQAGVESGVEPAHLRLQHATD